MILLNAFGNWNGNENGIGCGLGGIMLRRPQDEQNDSGIENKSDKARAQIGY